MTGPGVAWVHRIGDAVVTHAGRAGASGRGRLRAAVQDERGTGLLGTAAGLLVIVLFMLVAAHTLVHLYATSVVTAAAFDAARIVSGADGGPAAQDAALAHADDLVGAWASQVEFAFTEVSDEQVVLQVVAESPALLPRAFADITGLGVIDRQVLLRRESFR